MPRTKITTSSTRLLAGIVELAIALPTYGQEPSDECGPTDVTSVLIGGLARLLTDGNLVTVVLVLVAIALGWACRTLYHRTTAADDRTFDIAVKSAEALAANRESLEVQRETHAAVRTLLTMRQGRGG